VGAPARPVARLRALGSAIADWGAAGGGAFPSRRPELPWRSTRDPWAVLVSEVMAQQTQLARVVPAYGRFLARFPTVAACAQATAGDVLRAWDGLGYNRRALALHRASRAVVDRHRGVVPGDLASLLALPGVGDYTARAVLAFAFGVDVGVVDTNAGRVLSRAAAGFPLRPGDAQATVDAMVPPGRGWVFNQAILDLGATVCGVARPSCGGCPVRRRCRWAASGRAAPDPARGAAGRSAPQGVFSGSDRQGRGRLVGALRRGPVPAGAAAGVMGWSDDPERAARVLEQLTAEGMVARDPCGALVLP